MIKHSVYMLASESGARHGSEFRLKPTILKWLEDQGAYVGPDRYFSSDESNIRPFQDWTPCGHLVLFDFNTKAFANKFREQFTHYQPHLVHEVLVVRSTKGLETEDVFLQKSNLGELVCWCEERELERIRDFYFEGGCAPVNGEGYRFFFEDATVASLFKMTFA